MKILHVNTFDFGGAAIAAIRLHEGLLQKGIDSKMLFMKSGGNQVINSVYHQYGFTRWYKRLLKRYGYGLSRAELLKIEVEAKHGNYEIISLPVTDLDITRNPAYHEADIIHLHWVSSFLDWESFFRKVTKPIVWTCHDMNPALGIFHYQNDRDRNYTVFADVEEAMLQIKTKAIESSPVPIIPVAPSAWLQEVLQKSKVFEGKEVQRIPYGLPHKLFLPFDKSVLKDVLGLPHDKKVLLFVSDNIENYRKGFDLLVEAFKNLPIKNLYLLAVGSGKSTIEGIDIHYTGTIRQPEYLRQLYAAADLFIIPSREDNLPNTVLESMACGTPVIGFNIGGIPDMVIDGQTGLIAKPENSDDLALRIMEALNNDRLREEMGEKARNAVLSKYSLEIQAESYIQIYKELVNR